MNKDTPPFAVFGRLVVMPIDPAIRYVVFDRMTDQPQHLLYCETWEEAVATTESLWTGPTRKKVEDNE